MSEPRAMRDLAAFGVVLRSPRALPGTWRAARAGRVVELRFVAPGGSAASFSGDPTPGWSGTIDGAAFTVERGRDGDLLLRQEGVSAFHLSSDGAALRMDVDEEPTVGALRTLLDSVLFTVALDHGREALHGCALELPGGGVVAVVGDTGAGKSTLSATLRAHGLGFFADDIVVLGSHDGRTVAFPGPPVATLPESTTTDLPVIADLDGERWVAETGARVPQPVAAIVVLCAGDREEALVRTSPAMAVLRHALPFPADRQRARFEAVADVVERARVIALRARSAPPAELAATVLAQLVRPGAPT